MIRGGLVWMVNLGVGLSYRCLEYITPWGRWFAGRMRGKSIRILAHIAQRGEGRGGVRESRMVLGLLKGLAQGTNMMVYQVVWGLDGR